MAAFGSFALLIALALAAYNLLAGAHRAAADCNRAAGGFAGAAGRYGAPGRDRRLCGRDGGGLRADLVGLYQRFLHHLHLEHSNRALPGAYKFSALWSGQEGSLLLWAWLLGPTALFCG
jgi:cytochrome c-type biogenesis protein CcmF